MDKGWDAIGVSPMGSIPQIINGKKTCVVGNDIVIINGNTTQS
jgi:hypothetical protein